MCTRGIVQVTYSPLFVEGEVRGSSPGDEVLSTMCGSSIGRDGWLLFSGFSWTVEAVTEDEPPAGSVSKADAQEWVG